MGSKRRTVKSVDKAIRIVDILQELGDAGVTEITEHVDLSKGSVHTYLQTLKKHGFVTEENRRYRLSLRLIDLGEYTKRNNPVYQYAQDPLDELAKKTGELARVVVRENNHGVYLSKSEGEHAIDTTVCPGQREYLHCTSQGKAILAHLPDAEVQAIIDERGLPARTKNTITEREELLTELDEIGERGTAFSHGEVPRGMGCIAAPIHGDEYAIAAIGVCGPTSRLQTETFQDEVPEMVRNAANVIEINMQMGTRSDT
jgi:DNA-binding IclR family transcriptional regulator